MCCVSTPSLPPLSLGAVLGSQQQHVGLPLAILTMSPGYSSGFRPVFLFHLCSLVSNMTVADQTGLASINSIVGFGAVPYLRAPSCEVSRVVCESASVVYSISSPNKTLSKCPYPLMGLCYKSPYQESQRAASFIKNAKCSYVCVDA